MIEASAEPPRSVKSSPAITTGRPSTVPRPNTQLAGMNAMISRLSASYVALPAVAPISWKLPAIQHAVDALADGEAAALVLARDAVGAAHLLRQRDARAQFGEFRLPADRRGLLRARR